MRDKGSEPNTPARNEPSLLLEGTLLSLNMAGSVITSNMTQED